jgi:hypothetical protein
MTTKERVQALLERLPDDCSYEQIEYHVGVIKMLEQRLAEAEHPETQFVSHEDVRKQMTAKWKPE